MSQSHAPKSTISKSTFPIYFILCICIYVNIYIYIYIYIYIIKVCINFLRKPSNISHINLTVMLQERCWSVLVYLGDSRTLPLLPCQL